MIDSASHVSNRLACFITAMAVMLAWSPLARAADEQKVTAIDQIQFQQTNAQAQMQELQERMFRLAELTREAEPDDAAKLLMAVRTAREQLIIEQMRQALDLLSTKDLSHATDEQTQIIAKLEELKKLLTSSGMDLQMLLEKLRTLNQAIAKLEAATKEEKRQQTASAKQADAQKNAAPDKNALSNLQKDQQQNRKTTDSIAQSVAGLGGQASAAASSLGSASGSMSGAEGALGSGSPGGAQSQQSDAVQAMDQAQKQLQEERDKVLEELERMVRAQVVQNLTEMLDRQKVVRTGTEKAVDALASSDRQTLVALKQLGNSETAIVRIADQTITLIEETEFSIALPPALRRVQQKCALIAATLDDSKADAPLVTSEKEVERDLQDLLDTFKELASNKVKPGGRSRPSKDHNKLIAELKVLRMMQSRVNDDTRTVDGQRGTPTPNAADLPANIDPMLKEKILKVRDSQADVRDATAHLDKELTGSDPLSKPEPAQ